MYNRYIPQADGSYCKKKIPEPQGKPPQRPPVRSESPCKKPQIPFPVSDSCTPPKPCQTHGCNHSGNGFFSFFSQLLPKELDAADLMIIILLLLIAGDREEDKSNALLTLALYFLL